MKNSLIYIAIIFMFIACEEIYTPDIKNSESHLVFDGLITNITGRNYIRISESTPFGSSERIHISGFNVTIEEKNGASYPMTEIAPGYYVTDSAVVGKENAEYRFIATSIDGVVYKSSYEKLLPGAKISDISGNYYHKYWIAPNESGTNAEYQEDDIRVKVSSDAIHKTPFYRYEYDIICQNRQIYPNVHVDTTVYIMMPFKSEDWRFLNIVNGNTFGNSLIKEHTIDDIGENQFFKQVRIDSIEIDSISGDTLYRPSDIIYHNDGFQINIRQYSLTETAYLFWDAISKQINATGQFFDPVETQVTGNITCETNPDEAVYGFFGASAITSKSNYFRLGNNMHIVSHPLDTFPILNDTLASYFYPDIWYRNIYK